MKTTPLLTIAGGLFVLTLTLSTNAFAEDDESAQASSRDDVQQPAAAASTPAAASDTPAGAPQITPAAPKWNTPVGLRLDGGYSARKLLTMPVGGADLGVAFGAQPKEHAAFWGASRLFLGSTENGLSVFSFRLGADGEAVLDRFRIGAGLNGFILGVSRAVRNDVIYSWGLAGVAYARFDVMQSDSFAIFARAAIDAGVEVFANSVYWGPTLGAGIDFDLAGKRDRK